MSTMRDVAARAGVSIKTVSRVFNDDDHVTDETRARVRAAIEELAWVPNMLARGLRSGRDDAIGIAVPDIGDPFFAAIIRAVENVAAQRGTSVVVTGLGRDPTRERAAVEALLNRRIAGLISTPVSPDQSYLSAWQDRTPTVFVDRAPGHLRADYFVEEDFDGAARAVDHLVAHGHRSIAFLGDELSVPTTELRLRGYRSALTGHGLEIADDLVVVGDWVRERAVAALERVLARRHPPTAVFSSNAQTTIGLIPALAAVGRTDLAVVSFGDFPLAGFLHPPLTVVDQNADRLGALAARRLFDRMDAPNRAYRRRNVLPLTLIARGSGELRPVGTGHRPAAGDHTVGRDHRTPGRGEGEVGDGGEERGASVR